MPPMRSSTHPPPARRRKSLLLGTFFRVLLLPAVWWATLGQHEARAESAAYSEYEVKAAFLFNFIQFVKWPAALNGPVTIGILGDDPFGGMLEKTIQGEVVNGRKLAVKRAKAAADLKGCQIVFVSNSERGNLAAILPALAAANVLTVGEQEGFVKQGGAIGFTAGGEKVRFEINNAAAQRAGLEISARLLKLASRVGNW